MTLRTLPTLRTLRRRAGWTILGLLLASTALVTGGARAQMTQAQMAQMPQMPQMPQMTQMTQMTPTSPEGSEFMREMGAGMRQMDHDMAAAPMNGDADHDFVTMMIPHHQGAIDMAKVELKFGKDPAMRRLAQAILVDQQSEIDAMRLWLQKRAAASGR